MTMSSNDAIRWDEKYQDERYHTYSEPRQFLIDHTHYLPPCGMALDVAMGLGGNARYLCERGLSVLGVDISGVAVQRAKCNFPAIMAVQADLNHFYLPPARFDVIINFFYLQRNLIPELIRALRPGGLFLIETMTKQMLEIKPDISPDVLLATYELREMFSNLEIITYFEGWTNSRENHPRAVASLAARLPMEKCKGER
ncbi:MAG: class I SAM-dependent methyltransferase [Anaerolineales bacterium]|nr:class I SAM-dependent methyltransferase [Anaerolineales bacterium]